MSIWTESIVLCENNQVQHVYLSHLQLMGCSDVGARARTWQHDCAELCSEMFHVDYASGRENLLATLSTSSRQMQ